MSSLSTSFTHHEPRGPLDVRRRARTNTGNVHKQQKKRTNVSRCEPLLRALASAVLRPLAFARRPLLSFRGTHSADGGDSHAFLISMVQRFGSVCGDCCG